METTIKHKLHTIHCTEKIKSTIRIFSESTIIIIINNNTSSTAQVEKQNCLCISFATPQSSAPRKTEKNANQGSTND